MRRHRFYLLHCLVSILHEKRVAHIVYNLNQPFSDIFFFFNKLIVSTLIKLSLIIYIKTRCKIFGYIWLNLFL